MIYKVIFTVLQLFIYVIKNILDMSEVLVALWTVMQTHAIWILVSIVLVTFAMFMDLLTGIRKANSKGEATTSRGLRKTLTKAYHYYIPIICGATFDLLLAPLSFYTLPFMAMGISAYCIMCEVKSVMENTKADSTEMSEMADFLSKVIENKDDPEGLLKLIIKKVNEGEKTKRKRKSTINADV